MTSSEDLAAPLHSAKTPEALLAGPPFFAKLGYPAVRPGMFFGFIGPLMLSMLAKDLTADGAQTYVDECVRSLDALQPHMRIGALTVLQEGPFWAGQSLGQKTEWIKRYSAPMAARKELIRLNIAATSNVMSSPVTRAFMRTINTFSPPPSPQTAVATVRVGLQKLGLVVPVLSEKRALVEGAIRLLIERHAPSLLPLF